MLIDKYLPKFHFREYHSKRINYSENVYDLMLEADVSDSIIIKLLFRMRNMPSDGQIKDMEKIGFTKLEEKNGEEIVFGMISTSWIFGQCRYATSPEEFIKDENSEHIKAVINFHVEHDVNKTSSIISTETRVLCESNRMRNKFKIYWFFVQPFSKLIRTQMLKVIQRRIFRTN